ncbi:uncharacterized protein F5891DRAFT_1024908 [Suillus fuscotomentosus]|uniref:Uncharacterized protein n=1 Tax=Suillus fuscotomentosus TaxID=1912939 RepID=A0AAD4HMX0_9AGAM|nr:uncharacterized protein F5891DRAFT_1024908 [Suillus fuscotomentosus]KAG1902141.1 hypothetical protein F5891DRAFT_1024908 [Suillus fuscotomentosus]
MLALLTGMVLRQTCSQHVQVLVTYRQQVDLEFICPAAASTRSYRSGQGALLRCKNRMHSVFDSGCDDDNYS